MSQVIDKKASERDFPLEALVKHILIHVSTKQSMLAKYIHIHFPLSSNKVH